MRVELHLSCSEVKLPMATALKACSLQGPGPIVTMAFVCCWRTMAFAASMVVREVTLAVNCGRAPACTLLTGMAILHEEGP